MNNSETFPSQPPNTPNGVKLVRSLRGHEGTLLNHAFDSSGELLATCAADNTVRLWNWREGAVVRILHHENWVRCVAFDQEGKHMASGSDFCDVKVWNTSTGEELAQYMGHQNRIFGIAFQPSGKLIASASDDRTVNVWKLGDERDPHPLKHDHWVYSVAFSPDGEVLATGSHDNTVSLWNVRTRTQIARDRSFHKKRVWTVAFHPNGKHLASGSMDGSIMIWEARSLKPIRALTGHVHGVQSLAFDCTGNLLVSKARDGSVKIWRCADWEQCGLIEEPADEGAWLPGLAFNPKSTLLATGGPTVSTPPEFKGRETNIWELDVKILAGELMRQTKKQTRYQYENAKVVVVGDSGAGKSFITRALMGELIDDSTKLPSTHASRIERLESIVKKLGSIPTRRETMLWDLGGQHHYRLIHQLHLGDASVAIIVFDGGSSRDPLSVIRYWARAVNAAVRRSRPNGPPCKIILVANKVDLGKPSARWHIEDATKEFGVEEFLQTSATKRIGIDELRSSIRRAIDWSNLPLTSSTQLFEETRAYIYGLRSLGRLLLTKDQLFAGFTDRLVAHNVQTKHQRREFLGCLDHLENHGIVREMSFGDFVLIKPEVLDAFTSLLITEASANQKGSVALEDAISGSLYNNLDLGNTNERQKALLPYAAVIELIKTRLALTVESGNSLHLVFPSEFSKDFPDAPEPKGKASMITFEGAVQNVYATLVVGLAHSELFQTGLELFWRNAAIFKTRGGAKCGVYVSDYDDARGRITVFFSSDVDDNTRGAFESFVFSHVTAEAPGSVAFLRVFSCPRCSTPIPSDYVTMLLRRKETIFKCPCVKAAEKQIKIELSDPTAAPLTTTRSLRLMDEAIQNCEFHTAWISALGEIFTEAFEAWAGNSLSTLVIVMIRRLPKKKNSHARNVRTNAVESAWSSCKDLERGTGGYQIKVFSESVLYAFHDAKQAVEFAEQVIRALKGSGDYCASVDVGPVQIRNGDVWGRAINNVIRLCEDLEPGVVNKSQEVVSHIEAIGWNVRSRESAKLDFAKTGESNAVSFEGVALLCPECRKPLPTTFEKDCRAKLSNAKCPSCKARLVHLWPELWSPKSKGVTGVLVSTDMASSSDLRSSVGDKNWFKLQVKHFGQAKNLIGFDQGCWDKSVGDAVTAMFYNVEEAIHFLISFQQDTGIPGIVIRGAIDVDPVEIVDGNFQGRPFFFVNRMLKAMGKKVELWISAKVYDYLAQSRGPAFKHLCWIKFKRKLATKPPYNGALWKLNLDGSNLPSYFNDYNSDHGTN